MRWNFGISLAIALVVCLSVATAQGADPNDKPGVTLWALGGSGVQELRVGYVGLLPTVEFAVAGRHLDAPEGGVDEWPVRAYAIAHALDAKMLASVFGADFKLPDGNVYAGLYAEYSGDRDDEFDGGYVVGGLIEWPAGWAVVAEYNAAIFNTTRNGYEFIVGLRRQF